MSTFNDIDSLMIESGIDPDSYVSDMDDNSDFSEIDIRIDVLMRLVTLTRSEENELNFLRSLIKDSK
ncbi:hypothetical protein [Sulfuricurvum sp.]|uniref:hypothetical protein n=1 Tax=Sulfuricurvum sp. TaxID=2025608 RepID=UPI0035634DE3